MSGTADSNHPGGSLKDKIYHEVFESIVRGEYNPEDIISEKSLVEKYCVSKSPVREALIELCNEKILRSIPRYGYEVVRITDREVEDIRSYRTLVECAALDRYWELITPEKIQCLQDVIAQDYAEPAQYDVLGHWEKNTRFHVELISCFNNQYLYSSLQSAMHFLSRAYAQFYWDKWHKMVFFSTAGCHKKVLESIQRDDKAAAIRYLSQDISGFDGDESGLKP